MKIACVITTIRGPEEGSCREWVEYWSRRGGFTIIVPDEQTPHEQWLEEDAYYLRMDSDFVDGSWLPKRHYCRKMLGYIAAKRLGATHIFETDDDNYPLQDVDLRPMQSLSTAVGTRFNPYAYFGKPDLVPRGLDFTAREQCRYQSNSRTNHNARVWQWQCNGRPDLWAVQHMIIGDRIEFRNNPPIRLNQGCYAPLNSQHTLWSLDVLPAMYLPATCQPRASDILRGYLALRYCFERKYTAVFCGPGVVQHRNEHDYTSDIQEEWGMMCDMRPGQSLEGFIEAQLCAPHELKLRDRWYDEIAR